MYRSSLLAKGGCKYPLCQRKVERLWLPSVDKSLLPQLVHLSPFYALELLFHILNLRVITIFNVEYFFSSPFRFLIWSRNVIDLCVASRKCIVAQVRYIFCMDGEWEGGRKGRKEGRKEGRAGARYRGWKERREWGSQKINSNSSVFFVEFCYFFFIKKKGERERERERERACNRNYLWKQI